MIVSPTRRRFPSMKTLRPLRTVGKLKLFMFEHSLYQNTLRDFADCSQGGKGCEVRTGLVNWMEDEVKRSKVNNNQHECGMRTLGSTWDFVTS